jgi:hypothetical protein
MDLSMSCDAEDPKMDPTDHIRMVYDGKAKKKKKLIDPTMPFLGEEDNDKYAPGSSSPFLDCLKPQVSKDENSGSTASPQMIRIDIYPPTVCQFRARRKLSTRVCHPLMTKMTRVAGNRQVIISAQHHYLVTGRRQTSWMSACHLQTETEQATLYLKTSFGS